MTQVNYPPRTVWREFSEPPRDDRDAIVCIVISALFLLGVVAALIASALSS